jgi:hypothetical protein
MSRKVRFIGGIMGVGFLLLANLSAVSAADGPDFTKFGYATVAKSMDIAPDQAATITMGDQTVTIKAGTFDAPVTFDLLTGDLSTWKALVKDRTVRAAFAFRVTDKATKAILPTFKQPVMYTYSGKDAQSSDAILNVTAATPPAITPNPVAITFDGKVNHPFTGAGVAWLVVSAPTSGATGSPAAAPAAPGTSAPAAPVATGTGGGTTTTAPATLPQTGEARATGTDTTRFLGFGMGALLLIAGIAFRVYRRTVTPRA